MEVHLGIKWFIAILAQVILHPVQKAVMMVSLRCARVGSSAALHPGAQNGDDPHVDLHRGGFGALFEDLPDHGAH